MVKISVFKNYISIESELNIDFLKNIILSDIIKKSLPIEAEEVISKHAMYSYYYALNVLKGRFELGEEEISKDAYYSFNYARDIIKGRWELGEPAISKDAYNSYYYAKIILVGRFELGEEAIRQREDLYTSYKNFSGV